VSEIGPSRCTDTVRFVRESNALLWSLAASVYTKDLQTFYDNEHSRYCGSRVTTVSGIPNRLIYSVIALT
jgi:hypothetical protein